MYIDKCHLCQRFIRWCIRITFPCHIYPLLPHFYIAKLGYAGVYLFFLFLLQNIDCGYSLEPPRPAKIRKIKKKSTENFQFIQHRKICILHGHVFIMDIFPQLSFYFGTVKLLSR